jgi:hypothetical protein
LIIGIALALALAMPATANSGLLKPSDNKSKLDTRGLVVLIAKGVRAL